MDIEISEINKALDLKKKSLIVQYEEKLDRLKKELELRQKVEVHEIEERKNQHINDLMTNHEKAFRDMKDFYTDITRENLHLIKIHKEKHEEIEMQIYQNQKMVEEIENKNKEMKQPLKES